MRWCQLFRALVLKAVFILGNGGKGFDQAGGSDDLPKPRALCVRLKAGYLFSKRGD
jgi:hypothetical protein